MMKPFENDPFKWEYGILYVTYEKEGTNIKLYRDEETRNTEFEKAIVTSEILVIHKNVKVKHMVKFKTESRTFTSKGSDSDA